MQPPTIPPGRRLLQFCLGLWLVQVAWLGWWFAPEAADLGRRLLSGQVGPVIQQQDPFVQWLASLAAVIPPEAAYLFADRYEAGKDIIARYHLYPRTFHRFNPEVPPSFLFSTIARTGATFLIIRDWEVPPAWDFLADGINPGFKAVPGLEPAWVFRLDPRQLVGGYYD